jgi:hypothetical protein
MPLMFSKRSAVGNRNLTGMLYCLYMPILDEPFSKWMSDWSGRSILLMFKIFGSTAGIKTKNADSCPLYHYGFMVPEEVE